MPSAWDLAHPEEMLAYRRKWRQNNKEATRIWQAEDRAKHPERVLMYRDAGKLAKNARAVLLRAEQRTQLLSLMGGVCVRCGFDDPRALQVDHVNGDGYLDRRAGRQNTQSFLADYARDSVFFLLRHQLLCANCNAIKKIENGEHLHAPDSKKQNVIPRPQAEGEVGLA